MSQPMKIMAMTIDPALLDLPWETSPAEWPTEVLTALPRDPSRHIVRFANLSECAIAAKEIGGSVAHREYKLLRDLLRLGAPCMHPVAVTTSRSNVTDEEFDSVLVTEHPSYSLPCRTLFSQYIRPETATRLIDTPVVLLIHLHLLGFYWGDVSLSNTLFHRNAEVFAVYLVDTETRELYPEGLTSGRRLYDIDVARTNIIGELMDLQAGALLESTVGTIGVGGRIVSHYTKLRNVSTAKELFSMDEYWRPRHRVEKLNEMGYDIAEPTMNVDSDSNHIAIQLRAADTGRYHCQVMRLTDLDVQKHQGQRMFNNLEAYRAITDRSEDSIELVAHSRLAEVFEPTIHSVPVEMRRKLEPAEIFYEILEHRQYMPEAQGRYVTTQEVVEDYIAMMLSQHRDKRAYLGVDDAQEMEMIVVDDDTDEPMPEDGVELVARNEQTPTNYTAGPYGFTVGMKFKREQGARHRPDGTSSLAPGDARPVDNLASIS